jgi:hypothetical protein
MAYTPLTIGGVTFQDVEIPETLDFGGHLVIVKHDFPGGLRTIRTLGAFPKEMTWKGHLTGPTAFQRMQQFQRMAVTGQIVTLTWGPIALQGMLIDFEAHARQQWFIPYTLHFEPTMDLTGVISQQTQAPTAETQTAQAQVSIENLQLGDSATLPTAAGGQTEGFVKVRTLSGVGPDAVAASGAT